MTRTWLSRRFASGPGAASRDAAGTAGGGNAEAVPPGGDPTSSYLDRMGWVPGTDN